MTIKLETGHLDFVTAGCSHFTLVNEESGCRVTYRVVDSTRTGKVTSTQPRQLYFTAYLNGPDNSKNYAFIGSIYWHKDSGTYRYKHSLKARASEDSKPVKGIVWLLNTLQKGLLPKNMTLWHEGRCGRCGKRLTVPDSIKSGYGPECVSFIGRKD